LHQLPGEEHLGGGVGGGEQIFQQVGGVMPAAASVEVRAVGQGTVSGPTIEGMANGIDPGIVAAALLSHELEELIRERGDSGVADGKREGGGVTHFEEVAAGSFEGRKVEFGVALELAPSDIGDEAWPGFVDDLLVFDGEDGEVTSRLGFGKGDGDFRRGG